MRISPVSLAVFILALAEAVHPAPQSSESKPKPAAASKNSVRKADPRLLLDTLTIRKDYMNGDFEEGIEIMETGLKEKRPFDHNDSVFIFKHLGVMYAARYETRERGKYYMHQLLMTEPTAKIMDMYASDMIYMIFKNIQDEFESNRMRLSKAEEHVVGNAQTDPEPLPPKLPPDRASKEKDGRKGHALIWIGATTVVVVAGATAYFLLSEKPSVNKHTVQ